MIQEHPSPKYFNHPFWQAATLFMGEACCLILFQIVKKFRTTSPPPIIDPSRANKMLFLPSFIDFLGNSFSTIGLTMCAGSVYQMVRGFSIVVTAFIACCCFKRKQYLYHWTSLLLIILGISIVGFVSIAESNKQGEDQP